MKWLTWHELNRRLRQLRKEQDALFMLDMERKGLNRQRWVTRIYSRYARLRRQRERREMVKK